ncbi:hypothetical protein, partial [Pseudomonas aeruginosa]|uniref:hypothetical protein n=1 Tax=Pseudomonas aeruginosa TaxID=287 RepID=UPI001ED9AD5E
GLGATRGEHAHEGAVGEIGGILGIAQAQAKPLPEPASMLDAGFAYRGRRARWPFFLRWMGAGGREHGSSRHL